MLNNALGAVGKAGDLKTIKAREKGVSGLRVMDASAGFSTTVARLLSKYFVTLHFHLILIMYFNGIRDFGFRHAQQL